MDCICKVLEVIGQNSRSKWMESKWMEASTFCWSLPSNDHSYFSVYLSAVLLLSSSWSVCPDGNYLLISWLNLYLNCHHFSVCPLHSDILLRTNDFSSNSIQFMPCHFSSSSTLSSENNFTSTSISGSWLIFSFYFKFYFKFNFNLWADGYSTGHAYCIWSTLWCHTE